MVIVSTTLAGMNLFRFNPPKTAALRWSLFGVVALAVLAAVVHTVNRPDRWLRFEDFDSTALATQQKAAESVQRLGPAALPAIRQMFHAPETSFGARLVEFLGQQPVIKIPQRPVHNPRLLAARACRALGAEARPVIPELIQLLNEPGLANEAAATIIAIDSEFFPLTRAVTNQVNDAAIRAAVATRLGSGHYLRAAAVAALTSATQDRDRAVRSAALGALRRIDPESTMRTASRLSVSQ